MTSRKIWQPPIMKCLSPLSPGTAGVRYPITTGLTNAQRDKLLSGFQIFIKSERCFIRHQWRSELFLRWRKTFKLSPAKLTPQLTHLLNITQCYFMEMTRLAIPFLDKDGVDADSIHLEPLPLHPWLDSCSHCQVVRFDPYDLGVCDMCDDPATSMCFACMRDDPTFYSETAPNISLEYLCDTHVCIAKVCAPQRLAHIAIWSDLNRTEHCPIPRLTGHQITQCEGT